MSAGLMTSVYAAGSKNRPAAKPVKSESGAAPATSFMELLKRSSDNPKPAQTAARETGTAKAVPEDGQQTDRIETADGIETTDRNEAAEEKETTKEATKETEESTKETEEKAETGENAKSAAETNLQAMMAAILNFPEEKTNENVQPEQTSAALTDNAALQELRNVLAPQPELKTDSQVPTQAQLQEPLQGMAASQFAVEQKAEAVSDGKNLSGEIIGKDKIDETAVQKQGYSSDGADEQLKLLKSQQEEKGMRQNFGDSSDQSAKNTETDANRQLEELKNKSDAGGQALLGRLSEARVNSGFAVKEAGGQTEIQTPVLEQLKTGLEQGLKDEMKEFTLKLKPEGLGEVVIRLVNAGGKVGVHIGVSNHETEKLITSQMAGLKEMLEPLHAQVEEVYHNSQSGMGFTGFGQDMYKQQQQSEKARYHSGGQNFTQEESFDAEAEKMLMESRLGRLYAYV